MTKIKEGQERLQRRLEEVEVGPATRMSGPNDCELKYNGTDRYPMEFLRELSELQSIYYPGDVKWIGRHLEADTAIWWRVVRDRITNFDEFKELFTQKYWGQEKQDAIRDNLEYGRYNWNGSLSAVQYMERKLFESRQLTPPMTDRQLIKIARHCRREIEIAVVTRGINSIRNLESLISEYAMINQRAGMESFHRTEREKVNARSHIKAKNAMQPVLKREGGGDNNIGHVKMRVKRTKDTLDSQ